VDLCEFEANLVYKASSRTARARPVIQRNPVLKKKKKTKQNQTKQYNNNNPPPKPKTKCQRFVFFLK
jgi:hypothetical protein